MTVRRSLGVNLIASWGAHAAGLAVGLVLMPFVLRTLGDATYGTWLFINSIAGYSALMYLGFGEATSRYVARHRACNEWRELNQVVTGILCVFSATALVTMALAVGLSWLSPHIHDWGDQSPTEIRWVIVILGLTLSIGMVGSVFGGVLMGIQRFDLERGVTLLMWGLRLGLTLAFLKAEWGLLRLSLIYLVITIVENCSHLLMAFWQVPSLRIGPSQFCMNTLKGCTGFSLFAFLEDIARQLIHATDSIVIGVMMGPTAIVPYYIAHRLCHYIGIPLDHLSRVLMPRAGQLHASSDTAQLRRLIARVFGLAILLIGGFYIGAGFIGDDLIASWVGTGYEKSHRLMMVLLTASLVAVPVWVLRAAMLAMGKVRVPALVYLFEAAANLVLTLILIRPLGLFGVALGTAIPLVVVELGVLVPYALRQLEMSPVRLFLEAVMPQILPLSVLYGYCRLIAANWPELKGWPALIAVAAGGGAVLCAAHFTLRALPYCINHWPVTSFDSTTDGQMTAERSPEPARKS